MAERRRHLPQRWSTRFFTKTSAIGARSPAIAGWRPVRGAAAGWIASRESARPAIRAPASRRSNWHGCGGGISRHWFGARTANASKRIKRIAIIALARKLIVAMWRYLTTGLVPDQAVLKA
jgi:hypothetical protein